MSSFIYRLFFLVSFTGGTFIHSMMVEDTADTTLLAEVQSLPQDIKRYIVFLVLELSLRYEYVQERTLKLRKASLCVSPWNGSLVMTGLYNTATSLWNAQTGGPFTVFEEGYRDSLLSAAQSPCGEMALTGYLDNTARLLQVLNECHGHTNPFLNVLTGPSVNPYRWYDVLTGEEFAQLPHEFWTDAANGQKKVVVGDQVVTFWKRIDTLDSWVEKRKESAWKLFIEQELQALLIKGDEEYSNDRESGMVDTTKGKAIQTECILQ